jgi:hypothetical protein
MIPSSVKNVGPEAVAHYRRSIAAGASERFAEMVALSQPPGTKGTDRAFMQGRYAAEWLNQMPKQQADRMVREARAAGINTSGRFYMGGLADKRGHLDPEAWIDSTADIVRVAKKRDLEVHGIVDYVPPEKPPPKPVDINPKILREHVRKEMKANPKLSRGEATEKVKDRIVPHWKRKK